MINVLNCDLNFCILKIEIDITQTVRKFVQFMIWTDFWYCKVTTDPKLNIF